MPDLDVDRAKDARRRLIEGHLPLVRALARRYAGRGEPLEDLEQAGTVGLISAIDRFRPELGHDVSAFAVPTILGEIRHHLRDRAPLVRLPRASQQLRTALPALERELTARLGRAPTRAELAAEAGVATEDVSRARTPPPVAIEAGHAAADPFPQADDRLLVAAALRHLPLRERRIVELRYFDGLSQAEIARALGLSQVHVSRLLARSLARLRALLEPGAAGPPTDVVGAATRSYTRGHGPRSACEGGRSRAAGGPTQREAVAANAGEPARGSRPACRTGGREPEPAHHERARGDDRPPRHASAQAA